MHATQSSTGTARRRMFPILFFSNSLRSVVSYDSHGKTIILPYVFTTDNWSWEIQLGNVLFDLPEGLVPWFSAHGLDTSLISCSKYSGCHWGTGGSCTILLAACQIRNSRCVILWVQSSEHLLDFESFRALFANPEHFWNHNRWFDIVFGSNRETQIDRSKT